MKLLGSRSLLGAISTLTLLPSCLAVDIKASNLFKSPPKGKDGSCSGHDVDTMVLEAATLADNAIKALDTLLSGRIVNNKDNMRLADLAFHIWGTSYNVPMIYFGTKMEISEGKDVLQKAKENYQLAKDKLYSGKVDDAMLVCGDKDWQWATTMGDVGYTDESVSESSLTKTLGLDPDDIPGLYLSKYFSPKDPENDKLYKLAEAVMINDKLNGKPLCTSPTAAITWKLWKMIMMCDIVWDRDTLATRIANQDSLDSGASIDEQQTAGAEFLHEMMHWINKGIIDQVIDVDGTERAAYFWRACFTLANRMDLAPHKLSLKNADNYRTFALGVTLSKIDWDMDGKKP